MTRRELRYPVLRRNLRSAASCFADKQFQAEVWANPTRRTPEGRWDLLEAFEFIVDDLGSADLPGLVGEVLSDEDELQLFLELHRALLAVSANKRPEQRLTFEDVVAKDEWPRVQDSAAGLCEMMATVDGRGEGDGIG
jgi:hypothetical protein